MLHLGMDANPFPEPDWKRRFRRRLFSWYDRSARDLPWRRSQDPYAVWVSEVMLQQTQVSTVIPYFERFMRRFPNAQSLASADEQEVLKHWEGLGYYRRARQLHRASRAIVAEHFGEFPQDFESVLALPGVGRYTAGAVLSIALDQRHPILEANTIRLYSRLLAYRGDPRAGEGQKTLWSFAESILPRKATGRFNQALMELGATVCMPQSPKCSVCPAAALCPTHQHGWQDEIPIPKPKVKFENVHEAAVVVRRGPRVLLRRCPDGERWAGLWGFPRSIVEREEGLADTLSRTLQENAGVLIEVGEQFAEIKHGVTRFRIRLTCHWADWISGEPRGEADYVWSTTGGLAKYPLHVSARKIVKKIGRMNTR